MISGIENKEEAWKARGWLVVKSNLHHKALIDASVSCSYKDLPAPAMLSNFMGLCLVVFCGMVFYLVHRRDYRRVEPTNGEQVGFRCFN